MIEWLLTQNTVIIYICLFLILLGGAFGVPIPEDLPLIAAGIAINNQLVDPFISFAICYSSIILGDLVIFYIGHRLGPKLFEKAWFKNRVSGSQIRKIRMSLHKRSWPMIFLARHLFYMRTATFLVCGAVGMSIKRFVLIDLCAAAISTPIMISLGYFASEHWAYFLKIFKHVEIILLVPLLVMVLIFIKRHWLNKKKQDIVE